MTSVSVRLQSHSSSSWWRERGKRTRWDKGGGQTRWAKEAGGGRNGGGSQGSSGGMMRDKGAAVLHHPEGDCTY